MCSARPGSTLEPHLGCRPASEIDRCAGEGVVHGHDRVAVAGDPATVSEDRVESLSECERRVLGRVVLAGLEIADSLEDEVEPGVEGELLEQMVVEAGAGRDPDTPCAVEAEAHANPGLRRRAQVPDTASRRLQRRVTVGRAHGRAHRAGGRRPHGRAR